MGAVFWGGQGILYNIINSHDRARGRSGSARAARGDLGGCDSASMAPLSSHAVRGCRSGSSSARTMRVVAVAWLARCTRSILHNNDYIGATPQILFIYMAATQGVYQLIYM